MQNLVNELNRMIAENESVMGGADWFSAEDLLNEFNSWDEDEKEDWVDATPEELYNEMAKHTDQ